MTSSPHGETQISSAVGQIVKGFSRQRTIAERHELSLILEIGGLSVRLDMHGAELAQHLCGVFRHLTTRDMAAPAALHIQIAALTGSAIELLEKLSVPPPGLIASEPTGPLMVELHKRLAIAVDRAQHRVTAIAGDLNDMPSTHFSRPFAHMFGWLGAQRRRFLTHGAAIGHDGRGILLAGSGGQGKSTTALACALAGWQFVGDDFVMLERNDSGTLIAHSLYATGRLHPAQAARFPALIEHWDSRLSPEDEKLTLFPHEGAVALTRSLKIDAIALPVVGRLDEMGVGPLSRARALRALITDSIQVYPWLTRERAEFYAETVERLPCYTIRVGPDIAALPDLIERVLERAKT